MRRVTMLVLTGALVLGIAGCGRKGAPHAPGPTDQIIYPHTYPSD